VAQQNQQISEFSDFSHFHAFQKVGKKFSFDLKLGF